MAINQIVERKDPNRRTGHDRRHAAQHIHTLGFGLAAVLTVCVVMLATLAPDALVASFQKAEGATIDLRFKLRGPRQPSGDIVVVAIDEKSLREIGRWPWSRDTQAQLVDRIAADRPKVIGLDLFYSEPEVTAVTHELQDLQRAARMPGAASRRLRDLLEQKARAANTDERFARSLREAGNIVLALPLIVPDTRTLSRGAVVTPPPAYLTRNLFTMVRQASSGEANQPPQAYSAAPPIRPLAEAAASLGHVFMMPDRDGILRYEYLAIQYGDEHDYYPALGLEVARMFLEIPRERMSLTLTEGVHLGTRLIPTDQRARMFINYAGPEQSFLYISATDILHRRIAAGAFRDKAVLVGTTALATYDQKATPFAANYPGVEKNATVVENIVTQQFIEEGIFNELITIVLILLFGLGLGVALPRLRALQGATLAALIFLGYGLFAQALFAWQGLLVAVVYPLLTIALVYVSITVLRFMTEEKKAKNIRAMFSSYVSPRIVEELIKNPEKFKLFGERKELTMLFSDIKGFTTFCEQHRAEQVVPQLNEYLTAMTEVVIRWNGTLDKFIGDAMVAFWGAPVDQPDHAELAIKCALHMRKRLSELQDQWKTKGLPVLDNGIGINTGEALVGNIGAEGKKMDYTMIGDHVNLAARAEGLTRQFDSPIVITEHTAERLKALLQAEESGNNQGRLGHVALRKLAAVKVKGKDKSVVVYGLTALRRDQKSIIVEEEAPVEVLEMTEK